MEFRVNSEISQDGKLYNQTNIFLTRYYKDKGLHYGFMNVELLNMDNVTYPDAMEFVYKLFDESTQFSTIGGAMQMHKI